MQQIRDDIVTLLIAHEALASVLSWAIYELVRKPDELEKATNEIDAVLEDDLDQSMTMTDIVALERT